MNYEAQITMMERQLAQTPEDLGLAREIVIRLNEHPPKKSDFGAYTQAQSRISKRFQKGGTEKHSLSKLSLFPKLYKSWRKEMAVSNLAANIPFTQVFFGDLFTIDGKATECSSRLKLFNDFDVIPSLCHSCFKVQILTNSVVGLLQVYAVLSQIKLPRNNSRKCMIELREAVKNPYKAYIYCGSEDEAVSCRELFQNELNKAGFTGIAAKISHGCSEYSLKYPDFAFSEDGAHSDFVRPDGWDELEQQKLKLPPAGEKPISMSGAGPLSLRDVYVFNTWIKYAIAIGDQSVRQLSTEAGGRLPDDLAQRIAAQADKRGLELAELQHSLS